MDVRLSQNLNHMAALLGKVLNDVNKFAPAMGQAIGNDSGKIAGEITCQRIAHLNG